MLHQTTKLLQRSVTFKKPVNDNTVDPTSHSRLRNRPLKAQTGEQATPTQAKLNYSHGIK